MKWSYFIGEMKFKTRLLNNLDFDLVSCHLQENIQIIFFALLNQLSSDNINGLAYYSFYEN